MRAVDRVSVEELLGYTGDDVMTLLFRAARNELQVLGSSAAELYRTA